MVGLILLVLIATFIIVNFLDGVLDVFYGDFIDAEIKFIKGIIEVTTDKIEKQSKKEKKQ